MKGLPVVVLALAGLSACAGTTDADPPPAATPAPPSMIVEDLAAFEAYVATRPTPEDLRARYPGLQVVLPGTLTTRELRLDRSRYFAELDAQGRVSGGQFQ